MIKCKIKKGDMVKVVAGDDKGKTGVVLAVFPRRSLVVVEKCAVVKKATKPTDDNSKGGFITKEMPMHISNVKKVWE